MVENLVIKMIEKYSGFSSGERRDLEKIGRSLDDATRWLRDLYTLQEPYLPFLRKVYNLPEIKGLQEDIIDDDYTMSFIFTIHTYAELKDDGWVRPEQTFHAFCMSALNLKKKTKKVLKEYKDFLECDRKDLPLHLATEHCKIVPALADYALREGEWLR